MSLLNLPEDVLENILSCLSYDEVSRNRVVCRRINVIAKRVLNRGFHKVERYHAQCLKQVKSQLPRRESERRKHPLARHCDILTAVETRLSLLGMTFMKFIEMNICCFIPGKVLDELYKVLRYVQSEQTPVRAHEVLQELRDLSSMAMEHFDEKISPAFRKRKESGPKIIGSLNMFSPSLHHSPKSGSSRHTCGDSSRHKWKEAVKTFSQKQTINKREVTQLKQRILELEKTQAKLEKKIMELQTALATQVEKSKEMDLKFEVLQRKLEFGNLQSIPKNSKKGKDLPSTSKQTPPKKRQPSRRQPSRPRKKLKKE